LNLYECITILDASQNDDVINEQIQKVQDIITKGGGEVLKTDNWGRRKLAYEINKQTRGFYTLFVYNAPFDVNEKLEKYFKVLDPLVKFMLMRLEKKQAAATLKALEAEKNALAKAESKETEEVKAEAEKTEEVKTEEVKTEAVKTEAVKTEAVKTEAVKTEAVKTEAVKTEAVKTAETEKPAAEENKE
jgi:small subunit ribosomal protein S6